MDLNGDGHNDILSGSWPGVIFLFQGQPDGSHADGETIDAKDGFPINVGGGIEDRPNGEGILIRGLAKWETIDGQSAVTYRGKQYKSTPDKPIATTGSASTVHPTDWDGDGDCDLVVGDIGGKVHLVLNEGTAKSYVFGKGQPLEAGGKPVAVGGRAGPRVADWDGDGDLDLLVGAEDGSVSLFRNTGSATAPKLATAKHLVPPGHKAYGAKAPKDVRRGMRSKICVVDWNGDGRLDLLVGDMATQKPTGPDPTPKEKAEHDRIRKELEPVRQQYGELMDKLSGPSRVRDEKEHAKVIEQMKEVRERLVALSGKLPREYENHGWVWLFLRQP